MPDPHGYLLSGEQQTLLEHYAPVLVLWPEQPDRAPYPDDGDAIYTFRGSYHPRRAEFFLQHARVRYRRTLWWRKPILIWRPAPLDREIQHAQDIVTDADVEIAMPAELREAVRTALTQQALAARVRGFDLPGFRGNNLSQWRAYFDRIDRSTPEQRRSVIYGRAVQGLAPLGKYRASPEDSATQAAQHAPYDVNQTRVALQYWFQYVYDDWANRHEGDWESITLLLTLSPEIVIQDRALNRAELLAGTTIQDVGYSSHEDGYRRRWKDVQKTRQGRPIVYVARGSQASYFAWQIDGYPTSARVGFVERLLAGLGGLVRGRRLFGRRWDTQIRARFTGRDPKNTDWAAADPSPDDRLDSSSSDPRERMIPKHCRGVRRVPSFEIDAGLDNGTYKLETRDLFWLELVQEYGVQWGEDYFLPGTKGPSGRSKATRERQRRAINQYAQVEEAIFTVLDRLIKAQIDPIRAIPELDGMLRPLRPITLRKKDCYPAAIRPYIYAMWSAILRSHPEAWPGGPGLYLRWIFSRQPRSSPLLAREDPLYHIKSLLAQVRRTRYEMQHVGSKWDNPFAWVYYVCQADTYYYAVSPTQTSGMLDLARLDCSDDQLIAL